MVKDGEVRSDQGAVSKAKDSWSNHYGNKKLKQGRETFK
jgi:hypothetical protein